MYLRAGDEVVSALASKMTEARGWLYGRRRQGLSDKEIDEGWTQILEGMEAERLRTLSELLKFRQVAAQVIDDLPRGPQIVTVLSNIVRSVEDFCPQAYTWQFVASRRTEIHRTLTSAAKRLRVMADDVDAVYVPQKNPRRSQEWIEAEVAKWIATNGPGSSRHIAKELGVSHVAVSRTSAYQSNKPLPAPQLDPDTDVADLPGKHEGVLEQVAADELRQKIKDTASPEMLSQIGLELEKLESDALEKILDHIRDDANDQRPKWESRRQRV